MSDYRELIAEEQGVELWDDVEDKCEYCEVDVDDRKALLNIAVFSEEPFTVYIDGNNNLTYDDKFEDNKINYCPMCGRKL